jgi:hypothetical protein
VILINAERAGEKRDGSQHMHKREKNAPRPVYASSMQCARNESGGRKDRLGQRERESGTSGHMGKCDSFISSSSQQTASIGHNNAAKGVADPNAAAQCRIGGTAFWQAQHARPTSTFVP